MAANSSSGIYLQRRSVQLPDPGSAEIPGETQMNQRLADSSVPLNSAFISKEVFQIHIKKKKKEKEKHPIILEKSV